MRRWSEGQPSSLMREYVDCQEKIENLAGLAKAAAGVGNRKQLAFHAHHTTRLFEAMVAQSGKEMIVDSSKLPGRAMALALAPGIDLRVIHVVRDGRGVAWSMAKAYERDVKSGLQRDIKPKPVSRTALRWTTVNLAAEYLSRKLGPEKFMRVRYEDFVTDPADVLNRIGNFVSLDFSKTGERLKLGEAVLPGHQIAGNRLRMNASIALSKDETWRSMMPAAQKAAFERLGGWMLKRYGYLE